jgi:multicomponent Na+:H+ antiporter subunit G
MELLASILGWTCLIVSWSCLLTGSFFSVVGGIGIIRMPDFYSRLHAGGITDTMGAGLVMVGLMFQSISNGLFAGFQAEPWLVTVKLVMILFFLLMISPTSCHALAQAALTHDVKPLLAKKEEGPCES